MATVVQKSQNPRHYGSSLGHRQVVAPPSPSPPSHPHPNKKLPPPKPGSLLWPPLRRPIFVSLNFLACRPFSIPDLPGFWFAPRSVRGLRPARVVVVATEKALKRGTRWCHSQVGRSVRTLMIRGWKSGPTHHRYLKPREAKEGGAFGVPAHSLGILGRVWVCLGRRRLYLF